MSENKQILRKELATQVSIEDSSKNPIPLNSDGIQIMETQKTFKGSKK